MISTGIDFSVLMTLSFAMCASHIIANDDLEDICTLVPFALLIVYEALTGSSLAKQALGLSVQFERPGLHFRLYRALLKYAFVPVLIYPSMFFTKHRRGLHDMAGKAVVVRTATRATWIRAIFATILSAYAMLTFGCGQLISTLATERYDPYLVNLQPDDWALVEPPTQWAPRWLRGGRVTLPPAIDGLPLRATPYTQFYNTSRGSRLDGRRVVVILNSESHPFVEFCKDPSPALKWALPCDGSPRDAQTALFKATMDSTLYLDPRTLVGEHAKRFGKSFLLDGDELLLFRGYDAADVSVIWYALAFYDDDGELTSSVDYINIAGDGPDEHFGITIFWSGVERQEDVVWAIASSFRFDAGDEELASTLLASGKRTGSSVDLLNSLELADDKLPIAETLYAHLARRGLGFERAQFANWVSYRVEDGDLRFMDLNEKVWGWRSPDDGS